MAGKVKTLVVCVDRDDDLGKKAGIKGPVLGEKACLKAATALGLADPGDSDTNAIFQAIKTYKALKEDGEKVEVAILTGHASRGVKADRNVVNQLEGLKDKLGFEDVLLVSDGADDEQIIPVIQSVTKISHVQTIIIKQAKEIEKSYYVIKEVLNDPHFARLIFGLPGIVLLIYGVVQLLGIERLSINIVLGLVGAYLMIKGFGIEDALVKGFASFRKTTSMERASFPIYISSLLIVILAIWSGADLVNYISKNLPSGMQIGAPVAVASFLDGSLALFTLAILLFFAGRIIDMYYRGEVLQIRRYAKSMVTVISAYLILGTMTKFILSWMGAIQNGPAFLDFLFIVILAIIVTVIGFSLIASIYRRVILKHVKKGITVKQGDKRLGEISGIDKKKNMILVADGEKKISVSPFRIIRITAQEILIA